MATFMQGAQGFIGPQREQGAGAIDFRLDVSEVERGMRFLGERVVPEAAAEALTKTALDIQEAERAEVQTGSKFKFASARTRQFVGGRKSSQVSPAKPDAKAEKMAAVFFFKGRSKDILEEHAGASAGRIHGVDPGRLRFRGKLAIPINVRGAASTARNPAKQRKGGRKRDPMGRISKHDIPWIHDRTNAPITFKSTGIGKRAFIVKEGGKEFVFAREPRRFTNKKGKRATRRAKGKTRSKRARLLFVLVKNARVPTNFNFTKIARATAQRSIRRQWEKAFEKGLRQYNTRTKRTASSTVRAASSLRSFI